VQIPGDQRIEPAASVARICVLQIDVVNDFAIAPNPPTLGTKRCDENSKPYSEFFASVRGIRHQTIESDLSRPFKDDSRGRHELNFASGAMKRLMSHALPSEFA